MESGKSGGEIFGRLIAVRRDGLKLSQADLAARIDTSQANVARIEEGQPPSTKTLTLLAAALDTEPETGAPFRTRIRELDAEQRRLAIGVLIPMLVILGGSLSVVLHGLGSAERHPGGGPSRLAPQAVSAAPTVPPIAAGEAPGKNRETTKSQRTDRREKKRATPATAVSEPSLVRTPTTTERSPAPRQPVSQPVTSSPAPSPAPSGGSGGGSNNPPPQVQHGIGGGETWHGVTPGQG
jgi:transcriptional regulator with XRE-family HTH domain